MKAITICQPYAHACVYAATVRTSAGLRVLFKRVENRGPWAKGIRHRGPLAIHAGKSKDWLLSWSGPQPLNLVYGAVLGVIDLVDVVDSADPAARDAAYGRHAWLESHVHAEPGQVWLVLGHPPKVLTRPILYRGGQGLWTIADGEWERLVEDAGGYLDLPSSPDGAGAGQNAAVLRPGP